jgi:acetyltransferase EpsM
MRRRNKTLVIFGGEGIGRIAADIALMQGYKKCVFLNDVEDPGEWIGRKNSTQIVGRSQDYWYWLDQRADFFFAYVGLGKERETFEKLNELEQDIPQDRFPSLIHPTATISIGNHTPGIGLLFGPGCVVSPDVCLGDHVKLMGGSFVGHNSVLTSYAHLATNAVVGANVKVGHNTHVGSNAVVREKVKIGNYCLIGCGSVVLNDVEEETTVVGNPARRLDKYSNKIVEYDEWQM